MMSSKRLRRLGHTSDSNTRCRLRLSRTRQNSKIKRKFVKTREILESFQSSYIERKAFVALSNGQNQMSTNDFLRDRRRSDVGIACCAMNSLACNAVDFWKLFNEVFLVALWTFLVKLQLESIGILELRRYHHDDVLSFLKGENKSWR